MDDSCVDVALLVTETNSAKLKQRIEGVVKKLVGGQHKDSVPATWSVEPVYEQPTLPSCEVHGEACPYLDLQQPRLSEVSRHGLSTT